MISLVRQTIQNSIGRPKLIRETSYNFPLIPAFLSLKVLYHVLYYNDFFNDFHYYL